MNRAAEPPVSKHKPARRSTRAYPNTAAPAPTPQGAEAVTTRIRAATSATQPGFHTHAHASAAAPCERPMGGSTKVPYADVLALVSPSASAEYEPRGRAASVEIQTSKAQHSRLAQHGSAGPHATRGRGRHHAHQGGH